MKIYRKYIEINIYLFLLLVFAVEILAWSRYNENVDISICIFQIILDTQLIIKAKFFSKIILPKFLSFIYAKLLVLLFYIGCSVCG